MIQVTNLSKSYGMQKLFDGVTFSINAGERLGLVGRNGHGKSTLFRILAGTEEPDSGELHFPADYRVGFLTQHLRFNRPTVLEEAAEALPKIDGSWQETYRAEAILAGLGFSAADLARPPSALSGGYQVRLNLAKLLVSEPNLLLLDEPTNYLDIVALRWLERFMRSWPHEMMLITHDRAFMDHVSTHTIGIHRAKIRKIEGPTAKFYEQLEIEEEVHEKSRLNQERQIKEAEDFIRAFRAKASKAKAVQSRIKALDRMEALDKLEEIDELDFKFTPKSFPGKRLIEVNDVAFRYPGQDDYLLKGLSLSVGPEDRIAVIGRNGKGKSTFLRMLAGELEPVSGSITASPNLTTAYFGQTNVERLHPDATIEDELLEVTPNFNRTHARSVAGLMMFEGDAALKKIKVLSGGEKSRVLLGKLLLTPANLLLLDEPSNHLDMHSNSALLDAVAGFPGAVIIVTHSEMFLDAIAKRLVVFDRGGAELFEGDYQDFLRRRGWEEEDGPGGRQRSGPQRSKKELRQRRAEIVQRRSAELGPLQKQVKQMEEEIERLEAKHQEDTQRLIDSSKDGFGDAEAKLARELSQLKEKIDSLYQQLEEALGALEQGEQRFTAELAELDRG